MTLKFYKRPLTIKHILYNVIVICLFLIITVCLATAKTDYLVLTLLTYLIVEIIFNIENITIDNTDLTIKTYYLGGLFRAKKTIHVAKILKISSNSIDITDDPNFFETNSGIGLGADIGLTKFDLYQITYVDNLNVTREVRLHLYQNELNLLTK